VATSSRATFTNDRGQRLSARVDRPAAGRSRATALFAHCFTCSKDLRVERQLTAALTAQGVTVLSFDFAGLGRSGGDFADSSFSADVADLIAAASWLREHEAAPSLLIGHSLGGTAAVSAAPDIPEARAVATIGAPADPAHMLALLDADLETIRGEGSAPVTIAGRTFTIRRSFVEDLERARPQAQLARFDGAVLVLHSPRDEVVEIEEASALWRAAHHPKSFVSLDTADHLVSDAADAAYVAAVVAAWAIRYLPDPQRDPEYDVATVVARNVRGDGLTTTVATRGFTLATDEPAEAGGGEKGPTPYDLLGAALAGCTATTIRMYADHKGMPLTSVEATVVHDRVHADDCANCEHTAGRIDRFDMTLVLTGDLDDAQRDRLREIAGRCPVHRTLDGQIEVHTTLEDG
jgi:putative redox protein